VAGPQDHGHNRLVDLQIVGNVHGDRHVLDGPDDLLVGMRLGRALNGKLAGAHLLDVKPAVAVGRERPAKALAGIDKPLLAPQVLEAIR